MRFLIIIALCVSSFVSWANGEMVTGNVKNLDINNVDLNALEFTLSKTLHLAPKDNLQEHSKSTTKETLATSSSSQNKTHNISTPAPLQSVTSTEYKYIPVYYPVKIPVYYPVYIPKYIPISSLPNQP